MDDAKGLINELAAARPHACVPVDDKTLTLSFPTAEAMGKFLEWLGHTKAYHKRVPEWPKLLDR